MAVDCRVHNWPTRQSDVGTLGTPNYGRHNVELKSNVLYILRLVSEIDETAARLPSNAAKRPAEEIYEEQARCLKTILQAAHAEASEWKLEVFKQWDPSPLVSGLLARGGLEHTVV
ncbi:hypothetical protein EJ02DRAFT_70172 [Clathrospora elynae]|uniref:LYC1 C-terminal domain-containing protein n=1 Tax=Clathrospora elynae TaxID=706981 RepID=A0A6A5SA43_9PLEO|nr:hypothetical protein EJ02DRAFT_70172 [Clathrospora elynae]